MYPQRGDYWAKNILRNNLKYTPPEDEVKGSNTFAFNSAKTKNGETYLANNTHQPLDGPTSWYEVHLCSEEGTNIIGALFAGSPNVLIGANQNILPGLTQSTYLTKQMYLNLKCIPTRKSITRSMEPTSNSKPTLPKSILEYWEFH